MDFETLSADLRSLQHRALTEIAAASDPDALEQLQIQYLGKKGDLTAVLRGIGALPAEDRPRVGAIANEVGEAVKAALSVRGTELRGAVQAQRLGIILSREFRRDDNPIHGLERAGIAVGEVVQQEHDRDAGVAKLHGNRIEHAGRQHLLGQQVAHRAV